jgi:hypothetical protein
MALSDPTIGGVDINMAWSEVEPQQGVLNLAPLDAEMRDWAQAGKQFILDVAYWAAAHGIGVGAQGLVPNYPSNYADIKAILAYIQAHYPQTYIQFQTVSGILGAPDHSKGY